MTTGDTNIENNVYYTCYDLEEYNTILIIESYDGESKNITDIIKSRPDEVIQDLAKDRLAKKE